MRTIRLLLLAVAAVIGLTANAFTFESGDLKYVVDDNSPAGACVVGLASGSNPKNLVIPSTVSYNGTTYRVIQINYQAFKGNTTLTTVRVNWGAYYILSEAFANCTNLMVVTLPSSLMKGFYNHAFAGCSKLKTVCMSCIDASMADGYTMNDNNFPSNADMVLQVPIGCKTSADKWKSLGGWKKFATVEQATGLYDVSYAYLPTGSETYHSNYACVNEVDTEPYSQWNSMLRPATLVGIGSSDTDLDLYSVSLSSGLRIRFEAIANNACKGHTKLKTVNTSRSAALKTIGEYAFRDCTALTEATILCEEIGARAFYGCTAMTKFTPQEGIKKYGSSMLSGTKVRTIKVPASLTSFGYAADGAMNCFEIEVDPNNATYAEYNNELYTKDLKTLIRHPEYRTTIDFPSTMTAIGGYAFWNCFDTEETIHVPYGVTSIGTQAFFNCSKLKTLVVPSTVNTDWVGKRIVAQCSALTDLYVNHAEVPAVTSILELLGSTYSSMQPNVNLHVPCNKESAYKNAGWTGFKSYNDEDLYGYDFMLALSNYGKACFTVTSTEATSYTDADNILTNLTGGMVKMLHGASTDITGNVVIPNHITYRGKRYGVSALGTYSLPQPSNSDLAISVTGGWLVKDIEDEAAHYNRCIKSVDLPNIETIGKWAFSNGSASKLTSFNFPATLKTIGERAFFDAQMTSIILPYGVQSIGSFAFYENTTCKRIVIPGSVTSLGSNFASNCSALEELSLNVPRKRLPDSFALSNIGNCMIRVPVGEVKQYKSLLSSHAIRVTAGGYDFIYDADYSTCYHMSVVTPYSEPSKYTDSKGNEHKNVWGWAGYVYHPNIRNANMFIVDEVETDKVTGREYLMVSLGDSVFADASNLRSLKGTMATILSIGHHALKGTAIDHDLEFPTPLLIGEQAFSNMPNCPSVTILTNANISYNFEDSYLFDYTRDDFKFYVDNLYFKKAYDYCMDWDMGDGDYAAKLRPFIRAKAEVQPVSCYLEWVNYPENGLTAYSVDGYNESKKTLHLRQHDENFLNYQEHGVILADLEEGSIYKLEPSTADPAEMTCSGDIDNYLTENWEQWTLKSDDPLKRWGWDEANQKFVHPASSMTIPGGSALLYIGDSDQALAIDEWTLELEGGNPLDVNNDGNVDVGDVNAILAAILANDHSAKYDVNGDHNVDVGDVNTILAYILEH